MHTRYHLNWEKIPSFTINARERSGFAHTLLQNVFHYKEYMSLLSATAGPLLSTPYNYSFFH
jgi:hypothetical protein